MAASLGERMSTAGLNALMGELEVQHCWGSLWVLPMVDALRGPTSERSAIGATSVATLLLLEADDDLRGPTSERSAAGATSVVTLNTRPGRLVGLRPVCPGHHMVPERLVGLRLVSSGLRGSRGTAGRCCGQCVRELLRVEAGIVLGMSLGAESIEKTVRALAPCAQTFNPAAYRGTWPTNRPSGTQFCQRDVSSLASNAFVFYSGHDHSIIAKGFPPCAPRIGRQAFHCHVSHSA